MVFTPFDPPAVREGWSVQRGVDRTDDGRYVWDDVHQPRIDGSFGGATTGVRRTLSDLGVPLAGAVIRDGSGLSRHNRLRARTLVEVLRLAASDDHPDLRPVLTGLPVGGFTGSLAYRFADVPPAGVGRVRAKTGTLTGVSALLETFVTERPVGGDLVGLGGKGDASGERGPVTVDDAAAFTARFDDGAIGVFEATRFALGRKNAIRKVLP